MKTRKVSQDDHINEYKRGTSKLDLSICKNKT